jgi:hypothetical protein
MKTIPQFLLYAMTAVCGLFQLRLSVSGVSFQTSRKMGIRKKKNMNAIMSVINIYTEELNVSTKINSQSF